MENKTSWWRWFLREDNRGVILGSGLFGLLALLLTWNLGRAYERKHRVILVPIAIHSTDGSGVSQVQELVTLAEAQALEDASAKANAAAAQAEHDRQTFEAGRAQGRAEAKGKK